MNLFLDKIELPLKVLWKLSRNETSIKQNFVLTIEHEGITAQGEVAPNIRYGETIERIEHEFSQIRAGQWNNFEFARLYFPQNLCHSLRFGLESALVHWQCEKQKISVSNFLGLKDVKTVPTSYSIPIMDPSAIQEYVEPLKRFQTLKLKVNQESAYDLLTEVCKHTTQKIRVDGNEAWNSLESFMKFYEKVKNLPIEFIEQPFPATMKEEYKVLKKSIQHELMADESIEDVADFAELSTMFHSINIKLMKTGSYFKARDLMKEAKKNNMKCMVGCMIETSLGISSAMNLAALGDYFDLDGSLLLKEDPHRMIKEEYGNIVLK